MLTSILNRKVSPNSNLLWVPWPQPPNESQFFCRNSLAFRLQACGGVTEGRYWSERKWPEQINIGKLKHRSLFPSKFPHQSAVLYFEKMVVVIIIIIKKRLSDIFVMLGVCFCLKILLELLLLSWCLLPIFPPQLPSIWSKMLLHSGNLDCLIDVAKEEASLGYSVPLLHLEVSLIPLMIIFTACKCVWCWEWSS